MVISFYFNGIRFTVIEKLKSTKLIFEQINKQIRCKLKQKVRTVLDQSLQKCYQDKDFSVY